MATSVIARYWIGAVAWSMIHISGNGTGGDDGVAAGVSPAVVALVFDGGGRVTVALVERRNPDSASHEFVGALRRAGKDSEFESLR